MNLKKGLLRTITMGTILVGTVSMTSLSHAAITQQGKKLKLNIPTYRPSSGYSYTAGGIGHVNSEAQDMWKIYEYNDNGDTIPNYNNAIYCLKWGPGFGSSDGSNPREELTVYKKYADMKDPKTDADKEIINSYKATLPEKENYNAYHAVLWVLDHCYVPAPKGTVVPTEEQIADAAHYKKELLENAKISTTSKLYEDSPVIDDLIDVIQQLSIWYFTNGNEYKKELTTIKLQKLNENIKNLEDIYPDSNGWELGNELQQLYQYFIAGGDNAAKQSKEEDNTTIKTMRLDASAAKAIANEDYYMVGPYKIEETLDKVYTLEGTLIAEDGTALTYTLLDSNKKEVAEGVTLKDLVGENFYLKVSSNQKIDHAKFKVTLRAKQNTITYWEVAENSKNEQPVAEIVPGEEKIEDETTIELSIFDLALRKFITKVNETPIIDRVPVFTEEKDQNGNYIYEHTKEPIEVDSADIVEYTLRVYNEGDVAGYAKQIKDNIPEGLEFLPTNQTNVDYRWIMLDKDGKETTDVSKAKYITTDYLSKDQEKTPGANLIEAFDSTKTTPDYKEVKVAFKVVALDTYEGIITNIAEISDDEDENGDPIKDKDSTPDNKEEKEDDIDKEHIKLKYLDLALRKFITNINGKELLKEDGKTYTREPVIDFTDLKEGNATTAIYKHPKEPVGVSVGDIVIYTLRIYNEGEVDGYASSVTDYLPPQLEFVMDDEENFNAKYGWVIDSTLRKATTNYLAKPAIDPEDTLIKAFDGKTLDYQELKIKCRVVSTEDLDKVITNIAEITDFTDKAGNKVADIDSKKQNVVLPSDEKLPDYKGNESNKSVLSDEDYFYKGQEDDDDFEKLKLEEFDLALRKFITKVNETPITNRVPVFTNVKDQNGNYIYEHTKEPIEVDTTDIIEYTLRVYNEGDIAGYAKQIKDNIPEGLEFLPTNQTNVEYRWIMLDEDGKETTEVSKAKYITTDYLSKEQEKTSGANLIEAFDSTKTTPDYKEVKVAFKVVALDTYEGIITNIAEISDDEDEDGKPVEDKDSTPDNKEEKEDDIDKEHIKLTYFDLALRKFITAVNHTEITNRVPMFKIDENGNYVYEHSKEPVEVENGNIITYTLRVYNEGTRDGYAKEIKDNLPQGLEFLPENETNIEYRWIMIDENGEETEDITKAVSIKTDYLSKEQEDATGRNNLLTKFDPETMDEPNHKEVKIAFKVTEPNTSDRILINKAQISNDSDKNGKDVVDKDSTPDKWIDGEDDQDIEKVKVKYFDLSLRKWVTQAIVIDNGKETITETGHKAEDDPEEVVKVEIKESRLNKVIVKFRYKIRVKNEGEIAGYATEISDYIPEGLKFVAADNPTWKEVDGKVVTDQLKDTLLQPGETAEVEILLTWINAKDNFNLKINTAEISKDKNDSNTPDIDSTPNNKVPEEDDFDDAPVILTVKTGAGENRQYMTLGIGTLGILALGVILIKKYVL